MLPIESQISVKVFISYAHVDRGLCEKLEEHLSSLKYSGKITLWRDQEISAGANWADQIETQINGADLILLLISSSFIASNYCWTKEVLPALERHKRGEVRVIPIILRPVHWQNTLLRDLQALPTAAKPITQWDNQDAAFQDVAESIGQVVNELRPQPTIAPDAPRSATSARPEVPSPDQSDSHTQASHLRLPGSLPRIWNIPYQRNSFFTGQEEVLKQIQIQLQAGQAAALSQPQAISGLGGIGKTHIALEFAYRHMKDYNVVLWVLADNYESLMSGYVTLAKLLNLPQRSEQDQKMVINAVKDWLQTHDSWLLILDNADELALVKEFVPPRFGGHLLLTTRARSTSPLAKRIEVETMKQDMGALLLLRRAGLLAEGASLDTALSADVATAREICEKLGGLPLALDQAGAYIEEAQCSLQEYQERYRAHRAQFLKRRGGVVTDHPEPVATTLSLSFERVEAKNPLAADLLRLCVFLHPDTIPDAIPEEIIVTGVPHLLDLKSAKVSKDEIALALGEAIATLGAYSLISRNPLKKMLSVHRLVQAVLKDMLNEQDRKLWSERAAVALNIVLVEKDFMPWSQIERYLLSGLTRGDWLEIELAKDGRMRLRAPYGLVDKPIE